MSEGVVLRLLRQQREFERVSAEVCARLEMRLQPAERRRLHAEVLRELTTQLLQKEENES